MGLHNPRTIVPSPDVDFRAFYPYSPHEVKHRKRTTSSQLKVLETVFKRDTKPNASLRNELAAELDMTARGVQVWFQNRRAKEKHKASKKTHETSPVVKDEADDDDDTQAPPRSPPQLHLITDTSNWPTDTTEPPPDSATYSEQNPFSPDVLLRRGSLPVNAFLGPSHDTGDAFIRRGSVDASLQRLASNPFASLARAKNMALYGPACVSPSIRQSPYPPRALPPHFAQQRLSVDSRAVSRPRLLTPYHAAVRASLPDQHLYAITSRPLVSPIPGPLPAPGYQFGVASSTSPESIDSERNSPDSLRSFPFRADEFDDESHDAYSRFGSVASIATSDSSYYSELPNERRDSCQFILPDFAHETTPDAVAVPTISTQSELAYALDSKSDQNSYLTYGDHHASPHPTAHGHPDQAEQDFYQQQHPKPPPDMYHQQEVFSTNPQHYSSPTFPDMYLTGDLQQQPYQMTYPFYATSNTPSLMDTPSTDGGLSLAVVDGTAEGYGTYT